MKVWLVGAGPGDPELLTIRGRECLTNADVIIYDALANPALLDCAREGAELIYVGKIAGNHALPQDEINALLVRKAREGKNVVRLKGGDPYIFGRGGEEGMWLYEHGIPFEEVPGISSAIAAPAYAGIPLTDRRAASAVSIITGHESDLNKGTHNWQAYAQSGATLVFVMGMSNLANICRNLIDGGLAESTPAAVVYRGCTPDQKTVAAILGNLPQKVLDAGLANPAVIVVGKAVDLREKLSWFERLPLFGKRIVVTRARAQASGMAHDLAALGAEVIECPVIRVDPLEDYSVLDAAIGKLGDYDWVVFTSANGVDYFFRRLNQAGLDSRALAPCKLAAIGPGTAAALGCRGRGGAGVAPGVGGGGGGAGLGAGGG
ncbi:MAG: uroporphyrinogen-III C-methyltransferase, partial [Desulfovibrio sp.]